MYMYFYVTQELYCFPLIISNLHHNQSGKVPLRFTN
jgi:hypothetical protein